KPVRINLAPEIAGRQGAGGHRRKGARESGGNRPGAGLETARSRFRTPAMTEPHPTIRPQPGVLDIAPYQGGDSRLAGHAQVLKLSSNENPYGPSPRALEAFQAAAAVLHRYPDSHHVALRAAIAGVQGLDAER